MSDLADAPREALAADSPTILPLNGARVLELTHAWAGPLCGMMLADMGAEVIKVEAPTQSSEARGGFPHASGENDLIRQNWQLKLCRFHPSVRGASVQASTVIRGLVDQI